MINISMWRKEDKEIRLLILREISSVDNSSKNT